MSKILVITSRCYEMAHADGLCGRNIMHALKKTNKDVFLLGYTSQNETSSKENEYKVLYEKDTNKIRRSIISRILKPEIDTKLCNLYFEKACEIIEQKGIDTVISVFFPLETLKVLYDLKNKYPYLKTIDYEVDTSTNIDVVTGRLSKLYIDCYKRCLKKIYRKIDHIFIMKCHKEHFTKNFNCARKLHIIDSPVLSCKNVSNYEKETLDFVYAGFLNKEYYSPYPFLKLFETNKDEEKWRLHIYARGNCEDLIKEKQKSDNRIIYHGYVDKTKLDVEIKEYDFFLSIDNYMKPSSIPSKVFECFSMCKPLIHFACKNSYVADNYINKYPLGLVIYDIEKQNKEIKEFIESTKNRKLSFDEVRDIFYKNTPEYSAEMINRVINNKLEI